MSELDVRENILSRAEEAKKEQEEKVKNLQAKIEKEEASLLESISSTAISSEQTRRKSDRLIAVLFGVISLIIALILYRYTIYVSVVFLVAAGALYRQMYYSNEDIYKKRKTYFEGNSLLIGYTKFRWRSVNEKAYCKQVVSPIETDN